MTATGTATSRSPRATAIAAGGLALVIVLALAAWLVVGKNPSLKPAGMSWQAENFVQQDELGASDDDLHTWTVWDQPDGAWASIVVTNDRPYPVSIAPGKSRGNVTVQVAAFDPTSTQIVMDPAYHEAVDRLSLPPGESALVSMRVSYRCMELSAGSSIGLDVAEVRVTTFGITQPLEVQLPANYMAGSNTDYKPDAGCSTR
jgi:hypothetical protein